MISIKEIKRDIERGFNDMTPKERLHFYVSVGIGLFFILAVIF